MTALKFMRICHVGFSRVDGGAALALDRIHSALLAAGAKSEVLVADELRGTEGLLVRLAGKADAAAIRLAKFSGTNIGLKSAAVCPTPLRKKIAKAQPDLVMIHWSARSTLSLRQQQRLSRDFPVVLVLHDEWPFSDLEHYLDDKNTSLSKWPRLLYTRWLRITTARRKQLAYGNLVAAICPSEWVKGRAERSQIGKNWHTISIPYPLEVEAPPATRSSENRAGVIRLAWISYYGSGDLRKGFGLLREALIDLYEKGVLFELVTVGEMAESFPFPHMAIGKLGPNWWLHPELAKSDVLLHPSIADNSPLVVMESLSAGIPVVCFAVGGIPELVDHKKNGYVAKPLDIGDFSRGVQWISENPHRAQLSKIAQEKARSWSNESIGSRSLAEIENALKAWKRRVPC